METNESDGYLLSRGSQINIGQGSETNLSIQFSVASTFDLRVPVFYVRQSKSNHL